MWQVRQAAEPSLPPHKAVFARQDFLQASTTSKGSCLKSAKYSHMNKSFITMYCNLESIIVFWPDVVEAKQPWVRLDIYRTQS